MRRLNELYRRLLDWMAVAGALLILAMMLMITVDVGWRAFGGRGIGWVGEASEYILYLSTFLAAPWLLRLGRHVRLDLVLRALPPQMGWLLEWLTDIVGLLVCAGLTLAEASLQSPPLLAVNLPVGPHRHAGSPVPKPSLSAS